MQLEELYSAIYMVTLNSSKNGEKPTKNGEIHENF
jgi:hypothetical protein